MILTSQLMSVRPVLVQFRKSRRLMPSPMMANVTKVTVTTIIVILKIEVELLINVALLLKLKLAM